MKKSVFIAALLMSASVFSQTLNDAIRLTNNEQYEDATILFKDLISKDPSNATTYYYFGENYLLSENPDSAQVMYNKGASVDQGNLLIQIGKAKYLLNLYSVAETKRNSNIANDDYQMVKTNYDKLSSKTAEDDLQLRRMKEIADTSNALYQTATANVKTAISIIDETIVKAGTKNAQILIEAADAFVHLKNKELEKAKGLLDRAAALQPKNPEIKILFGDIYSELNNGTLAADYYNKAMELDPKSVKAIVNKGRLYKRSTNYEGAANEFKDAIKIDDSFAPAHRELGECYYRLGKLEDAKSEYKRYLELSSNNCGARIRYASFLYLSKDYSGAISEINQLNKTCDAKSPTLLRVTAYSMYETKDSAKALVAAQKLFENVKEDRRIPQDYEYYGKICIMNDLDSLGVDLLRKAYLRDNSRCDLLQEIWKSYDKLKKYTEAAAIIQEKIQNCKGATVTDYFNLGRSYFFSTDYLNADTAFAKVNELTPTYASGFLWRAKANAFIDSTSKDGLAKPHYEKYIEVATADTANSAKYKSGLVEGYRYLAAYYVQVNKNLKTALEYLNKILEIDPENKEIIEWKKSIEYELDPKNKKAGGK